jgi:tripartite ATP-independent transporter DctP family solute receptor
MKKVIALALAMLMLVAVLAGCGGNSSSNNSSSGNNASAAPIELNMNVTTSESSVWQVAANTFKQLIEERTDGRYVVNIYPNEQLSSGDMPKGVENIFTGVTDLDIHSVMIMQSFEEKLTILTMPWLFTNGYDSVDEILFNGPGKDAIFDLIRAKGAEPLALGENGFRQLTNNVREVTTPDDMKGLKIRIPSNNMYISLFKALGADPTTMNWGETFTALQQGTIDGQENPLDTIRSGKVHEVQKYMTMWNYSYDPICLSVSGNIWDSLSDADKEIFKTSAEEAMAAEVEASRAMDADIIAEFEAAGVKVANLTDDQVKAFQDIVAPIYGEWRDRIGDDLFAAFGYTF